MTRPLVVLTNPIDLSGVDLLARHAQILVAPAADHATLREVVHEADALIVRAYLPDDVFEHAPRLRGVVRHGAGVDMIPIERATAHAIPVANCPAVNATSVAEFVIAQCLALAHRLPAITDTLRLQGWAPARAYADTATELSGKTMGIVGVGAVGSEIARIAHHGLRMRLVGHQRRLNRLPPHVTPVDLPELFRASDFVVLACPLTDATRKLVDADRLALMKPGAFLVNVSRGPVVDERALVDALRARRIAGAALDVFDTQPLTAGHPLAALDNVILTPHLAGITADSMRRMSALAAEEVLRMLRGEPPRNFVNPEVLPRARERWARLGSFSV